MKEISLSKGKVATADGYFKLTGWIESMSDKDKQKMAASFDNPVDNLRVFCELQKKYDSRTR